MYIQNVCHVLTLSRRSEHFLFLLLLLCIRLMTSLSQRPHTSDAPPAVVRVSDRKSHCKYHGQAADAHHIQLGMAWGVILSETLYISWLGSCSPSYAAMQGLGWGVNLLELLFISWPGNCNISYPGVQCLGGVSHSEGHCTQHGQAAAAHHTQLCITKGGVSHCQRHCTYHG